MDRRDRNPLRFQQIYGITHPRDVSHRIQRAHLMEMYLFYRAAMGFRLSARDRIVDLSRIGAHLLRQIQTADQL